MILDYGKNRTRELIRQTSLKLREISVRTDEINIDDALSYFERRTDTEAVRGKYKDRAAIGIRKKEGDQGYETYTKSRVAEMIDQGELEVITVGTGPRILGARATLFSYPTQSWDWTTQVEEKDQPDEETAKIITEQREAGGFWTEVPNADWISCGIETGPLHVDWMGGHLDYRAFSPNAINIRYGESIEDSGVQRGVDYHSLEDALVVVVLLSGARGGNDAFPEVNQYVAYFGRSDIYPYGRRVQFFAQHWQDIPDVDADPTAHDYRLASGEIANPLSWMASKKASEGIAVPEYPIVLMHGGLSRTADTPIPISTSLYESCLEIDVAFSKLLKASQTSALGKDVLTNELGHELPRCLEGAVLLRKGQTLQIMGQPVSNAQGAMEITKDTMRALAEGYNVPGYQVIAPPGGNPESGIALIVRTQPLIKDRDDRAKLNKKEVERLWQIERYMYEFVTGKPLGTRETKQIWNPGRYIMPETETEKVTRLTTAMDKGLIDYVRAIRDFHNLATDKDAIEFIEKMQDPERTIYKAPTASGAQRTGLPLGISARLAKPQDNDNQDNQDNQDKNQLNQNGRRPPPS